MLCMNKQFDSYFIMEHKAGFYIFGEFQYLLRSNKVKGNLLEP